MDHNLDFLKHSSHSATDNFINMMIESSSFPCITRPTRVTKNSATLIDNIFVNLSLSDKMKSSIIVHNISDHFPSICLLENVITNKRVPVYITTRDVSDCKIAACQQEINSIKWQKTLVRMSTNESYDYFHSIFIKALDTHVPIIESNISAKQFICEPWLSKSLIRCGKK